MAAYHALSATRTPVGAIGDSTFFVINLYHRQNMMSARFCTISAT
jgi:hypothetical protein